MKNLILFLLLLVSCIPSVYAQLDLLKAIDEKSLERKNFVLLLSSQNSISKAPYYGYDKSSSSGDRIVYFNPTFKMDGIYRFGKNFERKTWVGVNLETVFSIAQVSAKFCAVVGYRENVSFTVFYDAMSINTNHHSDTRSLSKNYETSYAEGARLEVYLEKVYLSISYEKSTKVDFLNAKVTYEFIPQVLSGGFETQAIYGSGPVLYWTFGKKIKQVTFSWLIPKASEKEMYESRNNLNIGVRIPIY